MTDATNPIVFYDIASPHPKQAWSPNTWKTRYSLNLKGLHYRTEWLEYPDIEPLCKKIGAAPTMFKPDGKTPHYTLPVIYDPSTSSAVSDSFHIALYLDKTYPHTPNVLFPPGTKGLQVAFERLFMNAVGPNVRDSAIGAVLLNPASEAYFHSTREEIFGCAWEDIAPKGEERKRKFEAFKEELGKLAQLYEYESNGLFVMGKTVPSYADVVIAGFLMWFKLVLKEEWEEMATWQDGRWGRFLAAMDEYAQVDDVSDVRRVSLKATIGSFSTCAGNTDIVIPDDDAPTKMLLVADLLTSLFAK